MTPERIIGLTVLDPRGVSLDSPVGEDSSDSLVDLIPDTSTGETDGALVSESLRRDHPWESVSRVFLRKLL